MLVPLRNFLTITRHTKLKIILEFFFYFVTFISTLFEICSLFYLCRRQEGLDNDVVQKRCHLRIDYEAPPKKLYFFITTTSKAN